ncbi:MAG: TRAP transporter small permease [Clostridiales Family XIII bacterium]|nr:TRAP transporter small permease [Clostridiales Family XIII bacterium]
MNAAIIVAASGTTLIIAVVCILRAVGINLVGYDEILIMVAFWLYMFGCARGTYEKTQITADILLVSLPDKLTKDVILFVRDAITFALGIVFMFWALSLFLWSIEIHSVTPAFRIPTGIGQISVFVGLLISSIYNACYLYDSLKKVVGRIRGHRVGENAPIPDKEVDS